jgi:hypothetical protein
MRGDVLMTNMLEDFTIRHCRRAGGSQARQPTHSAV